MFKQFFSVGFVLLVLCATVTGCESTMEQVEKTDQWIQDHMW